MAGLFSSRGFGLTPAIMPGGLSRFTVMPQPMCLETRGAQAPLDSYVGGGVLLAFPAPRKASASIVARELPAERPYPAYLECLHDEDLTRGRFDLDAALEDFTIALLRTDAGFRPGAARLLGMHGGQRAVEPLIAALYDENAEVRRAAAGALGRLKDQRAVEPLIAALEDEDREVRETATLGLGSIGDPQAADSLIAAYGKGEISDLNIATALSMIGDPRAVELLIPVVEARDSSIRNRAATVLRGIGFPHADELLLKASIGALRDKDPSVRADAAQDLGKLNDRRAVEPLIAALADDKDREVRVSAAYALGDIGGQRAVEALTAVSKDEPDHSYAGYLRMVAREALFKIKVKEVGLFVN